VLGYSTINIANVVTIKTLITNTWILQWTSC
jgi:hypothetical protein